MKYFTFDELLRSDIAAINNIANKPISMGEFHVYENLEALVDNLLDPIRERFKTPMIITSGYRCESLNRLVKGVWNSQHREGRAADFYFADFTMKEMYQAFFEISEIFDFDQLIYYKKRRFIHISYNGENNRHESFIR